MFLTIGVGILILACLAALILLNKPPEDPGKVSRGWIRRHIARDEDDR